MVTQMLSSSHSKTHSLPLRPFRYNLSFRSNGNVRFRQLREATVVSFRVGVRRPGRKSGPREGRKNAAAGRGSGGGRDGNGPVWAAAAGLGRPTTRKVPPPPTYANGNDARGRHPSLPRPRPTDAWTRGRTDGRTDARCRHPPLPLP